MSSQEHVIDVVALHKPIYEAVGRGLSVFSGIESNLALIFATILAPNEPKPALIAFDAIQLTSPKIRTLRAVAVAKLDHSKYSELQKILKRVEALTDFRIKLAHWTVSMWHPETMPITQWDDRIESRLVPPWFSGKNISFSPQETVSIVEIERFTGKCSEVSTALIEYVIKLKN